MGFAAINQYQCSVCKGFHGTEDIAELCCNPNCMTCGELLPPALITPGFFRPRNCQKCSDLHSQKQQAKRARECTMIDKPSTCFVCLPGNDGLYINLNDYEDSSLTLVEIVTAFCLDRVKAIPVPSFVFDCDEEEWKGLDLDQVIENELEEWFDDAADYLYGLDELKAAVKKFNAAQSLTQYHGNDSVIVLDPVAFAEYIKVAE